MSHAENTKFGQCQATAKSTGEQCGRAAIADHGKCGYHGGATPTKEENPDVGNGEQDGNQNSQTHALTADLENYFENLTESDREEVWELSESIQDRVRANGGSVDILDRKLSRRVAIKIHIADHATDYALAEELMQTIEVTDDGAEYEKEIPHGLLDKLRQFDAEVFSELKKLGALDDPESQKADALGQLAVEVNRTHVTEENIDEYADAEQ